MPPTAAADAAAALPYTLSITLSRDALSPGDTLRGEVVVEVNAEAGLFYRRIHLSLTGVERNSIRDDQGEFDTLLEDFTSDRYYLHRHVTLSGRAYPEEDAESAAQLRSELQYQAHRIPPYVPLVPTAPPSYTDEGGRAGVALLPAAPEAAPSPDTQPAYVVVVDAADAAPAAAPAAPRAPGVLVSSQQVQERAWSLLECGQHTYPFFFRLPPWLPPSLYYEVPSASGSISYAATATIDFLSTDRAGESSTERRHFVRSTDCSAPFYVLSTIPRKQLLASQDEAILYAAGLSAPLPPLSATHQVFRCRCLGNLCHLLDHSLIDVEVALQSSRTLVLSDRRRAVRSLLRDHCPSAAAVAAGRPVQYGSYDAFAHRGPPRRDETDNSGTTAAPETHGDDALAERVRAIAQSLPTPVEVLPLVVRVHNNCQATVIDCVRVELRESVHLFKALSRPHMLRAPFCRYDYTEPILPGEELIFQVSLALPRQFRRCKEDPPELLPPPGVRTANFRTFTNIHVSFPGVPTYVLEEDWPTAVVQLAEVVDMGDEVMSLPTRFS